MNKSKFPSGAKGDKYNPENATAIEEMKNFISIDPPIFINEKQLGILLGGEENPISVRAIQQWRVRGFGPPFFRMGRLVRYEKKIALDWARSRLCASTSKK